MDQARITFGRYTLLEKRHNGRPVYTNNAWIHKRFIYSVAETGKWLVGPTIGADRCNLRNTNTKSEEVPSTGWQYSDNGWHNDPKLIVRPID